MNTKVEILPLDKTWKVCYDTYMIDETILLERNRKIYEMYSDPSKGLSFNDIAKMYDLTSERVRQIYNKMKEIYE